MNAAWPTEDPMLRDELDPADVQTLRRGFEAVRAPRPGRLPVSRTPTHHCAACDVSWRGLACWHCGRLLEAGPIPNVTRSVCTEFSVHFEEADGE